MNVTHISTFRTKKGVAVLTVLPSGRRRTYRVLPSMADQAFEDLRPDGDRLRRELEIEVRGNQIVNYSL